MIDTLLSTASDCFSGAMLIFIILVGFGAILGGRKGASRVIKMAITLAKAVFRASVTAIVSLTKAVCSCVFAFLGYVGRCAYRSSRICWSPALRSQQHPLRVRIQRLDPTRGKDGDHERSRRHTYPPDTFWE